MNSELLEKQFLFMFLVPRLLDKAHEFGFKVTGGDLFRDPRVHGTVGVKMGYGHPKSAHKQKLAIDLNIYKDKNNDETFEYCSQTEDHRELGEWWEKQHPLCRWGGRFNDGNHYSIEHNGVK